MEKTWQAVCHDRWWTHVDELMAILLIQLFGQHRWLGLGLRNVLVLGLDVPADLTPAEMEAQGFLPIGIGGGPFDDHREGGKIDGKSAAQLVAEELGILEEYPVLKAALAWVNQADTEGNGGIGSVAFTLLGFDDPIEAIEYFELSFKVAVNYRQLTKYAQETIKAYQQPRKQTVVSSSGIRFRFKIVELPEGVPSLASIAFGKEGEPRLSDQVDWIVQIYPTGHLSLRANYNRLIDLEPIFQALVRAEARHQSGKVWHREQQKDESKVLRTPTIVNGGTTHWCIVPKSELSDDELLDAFKEGIEQMERPVQKKRWQNSRQGGR